MAVKSAHHFGCKPVADRLEDVQRWQRLSAGNGSKGPRLYDWAWLPDCSDVAFGWR
jgi:hypothetical protein